MIRYSQYAICPRCTALAGAGADIEPEHAVRYIWGDRESRWGPSECDEASETEWRCLACHDRPHLSPDWTPKELAALAAGASEYEEDDE